MAIAYDSSSLATQVQSTSLSWNHTCTGSDRILVVGITTLYTDGLITGVTYNSVSMTYITKVQVASGGRWMYLYYLVAPTTGTNAVAVSLSSTEYVFGMATSYTGASQTGQPDNQTTNTGTSVNTLSTSLTTVADNCWSVLFIQTNAVGTDPQAGCTERQDYNACSINDSNVAKTPAGSVSLAKDSEGLISVNWGAIMASFKPVATAGGTTTPVSTLAYMGCG